MSESAKSHVARTNLDYFWILFIPAPLCVPKLKKNICFSKWHLMLTQVVHSFPSARGLWSSVKLVRAGGWETGNGSRWRNVHLPRAASFITGRHMEAWAHSIFTLSPLARETSREGLLVEDTLINVFNICVMRPCYIYWEVVENPSAHWRDWVSLFVFRLRNLHPLIMSGLLSLVHSVTHTDSFKQPHVSMSGPVYFHDGDSLPSGGPVSHQDWYKLSRQH